MTKWVWTGSGSVVND